MAVHTTLPLQSRGFSLSQMGGKGGGGRENDAHLFLLMRTRVERALRFMAFQLLVKCV